MQPSQPHLRLIRVNKTGFIRVIKSNAKTSVTTYIHATTCIFITTNIHVSADDIAGITTHKKKYLGVLDANVAFFEIKV